MAQKQGLRCWNPAGKMTIDTNTMTGRIIGQRTIQPPYIEAITVNLSEGKKLWWFTYAEGDVYVYTFRAAFVDPSRDQKPNEFTVQVGVDHRGHGVPGTAYVFWGEC